jgi:hypothetical protein
LSRRRFLEMDFGFLPGTSSGAARLAAPTQIE